MYSSKGKGTGPCTGCAAGVLHQLYVISLVKSGAHYSTFYCRQSWIQRVDNEATQTLKDNTRTRQPLFPEKHALQAIRAPAQELPLLCLANGGITLLEASKRASSVLRNLQLLTRSYFMRRLSSGIQVSNQWKCPPEMRSGMLFVGYLPGCLTSCIQCPTERTAIHREEHRVPTALLNMNALLLALIIRKLFLLGVI
jgi:hypothetical protein